MDKTEIVILLHGIGRTASSLRALEKALSKEGYTVYSLNYAARKKTLEEAATDIFEQTLHPLASHTLHFVTHSMGGLVVRLLLSQYTIPYLGRIVMLAPPNQGSEVADFFQDHFFYRWFYGPAGQQLTQSVAQTLPLLPQDCEFGIIAGNRSWDPFCYFLLPKGNDGKVSIKNTQLKHMKDHIILPVDHSWMMYQTNVISQVKYFLKYGRFYHSNSSQRA